MRTLSVGLMYGDRNVLQIIAMMWKVHILVLNPYEEADQIWHNQGLKGADIILCWNRHNHYSGSEFIEEPHIRLKPLKKTIFIKTKDKLKIPEKLLKNIKVNKPADECSVLNEQMTNTVDSSSTQDVDLSKTDKSSVVGVDSSEVPNVVNLSNTSNVADSSEVSKSVVAHSSEVSKSPVADLPEAIFVYSSEVLKSVVADSSEVSKSFVADLPKVSKSPVADSPKSLFVYSSEVSKPTADSSEVPKSVSINSPLKITDCKSKKMTYDKTKLQDENGNYESRPDPEGQVYNPACSDISDVEPESTNISVNDNFHLHLESDEESNTEAKNSEKAGEGVDDQSNGDKDSILNLLDSAIDSAEGEGAVHKSRKREKITNVEERREMSTKKKARKDLDGDIKVKLAKYKKLSENLKSLTDLVQQCNSVKDQV